MNQPHEQIGLIIVDHGSKRDESNRMLEQFVEQFAGRGGYDIVEPAHMELAEPSIAAAFSRCVERGATRIIVVPYFLGPGKHWDQDIPNLTAGAAHKHPGVTHQVAEPIGLHPKMIDVIRDRADQCR
jgi:sirohydrochlorin ferrochelatase